MAKTLDEAGVKRLIQEIKGANKNLNAPIPISTENTPESMAQNVKNIADYVAKAKAAGVADVDGMAVTCLIDGSYSGVGYLYGDTDTSICGIEIFDDSTSPMYFKVDPDGTYGEVAIIMENNTDIVTSDMLVKGARKPIILTPNTTEVDEETYQKLLSDNVDVVFKTNDENLNLCILTYKYDDGDVWCFIFTCFSREGKSLSDTYFYGYEVRITKIGNPHPCEVIDNSREIQFSQILKNEGFINKSTLSPVLQEIDLTGTDADRKAKLDQFETDWKALTGASDLTGARFVGKFGITDDVERNVTGIMTYSAGDTATEAIDNCFYGICNGYSMGEQKSQIAVKVSCTDGSLTITSLFSHLEAITIYTDNTPEHKQANLDNIAAYKANLQAFGVDMSKGFNIPVMVQGDNWGGYISSIGSGFYVGFYRDDISGSYAFRINADGLFMDYALALSEDVDNKVDKSLNAKSLEAIAIKTDNSTANVAAIKAYVDNLKALGVDTTKGYEIPILYNSGSKGFIGYNPNAASSFNGYAVTPEGNLHTLTMNATTGALSNKILATTAITDALSANKQPKTDAALKTTSKTVTGAINEVNDKTAYMAFTDVTKLSTNLGKRLIYKGGNVTLSSPITINSNINEIDFNGATLTVDSLAKTGISVITGHSHCIIKNLIVSGTWSVNTGTVNNIIDTFSGVENVFVGVTINGTHYGRGFHNCQRLISCKSEIKGANITEGRAYNYCEYLYMCRVGANSKGTGFFHCTSMDSCDILNGGCMGSELKECSNYTKVSYDVNGVRKYFSDTDSLSVGGSDISTTINNLRKIVIYSQDDGAAIQAKVDMFLAADKDSTVLYYGSKFEDKYDRLVPLTAFQSSNGLAFMGYLSGKDNNFNFVPDVDFVRVVIYKNSGLWNIAFPSGKFITTTTQKLGEREQNIAKLNIDAGSKAIIINYDDVKAAEAALTKYNEDPQKTVILVNYKTIRIPAVVSPTFIVAFVSEGVNLRKLLYRHNTSTWDNSTVIYGDTVRYSEQTLTDAQKETVRNNIGIDVNKSYVDSALNGKQDKLTSGTNIKTVNGQSLLGSGDIAISAGGGSAPVLVDIDDITGSAGVSVPVDVFNKIANAASAKIPIFGYSKLVNDPRTTYEIIPLYVKNVSTTAGTNGSLSIQFIAENAYNSIGIMKSSDTECSILINSSRPFALDTSVDKSSTRGIQSSAVWNEIHSEPMTINTATSGVTTLSSTDKHKILCYADSGTQQYNLPSSPVDGETFLFLKVKSGHTITIQSGTGNENIYDCSSGNSVVSKTIASSTNSKITVTYSSTVGKWFLMADDFIS